MTRQKSLYQSSHNQDIFWYQLHCLDILCSSNSNVLCYLGTGLGKTRLGCFFSLISSVTSNVYICVPNQNLVRVWESELMQAINYIPIRFIISAITVTTTPLLLQELKSQLVTSDRPDIVLDQNTRRKFSDAIIIIDEAHRIFDNMYSRLFRQLQSEIPSLKIVMFSATPITNTIETLHSMAELLSNANIDKTLLFSKTNKVYEYTLTSDTKLLSNLFQNRIIFFDEQHIDMAQIREEGVVHPMVKDHRIVPVVMSQYQATKYQEAISEIKNPMFSKLGINLCFCALFKSTTNVGSDLAAIDPYILRKFPIALSEGGYFVSQLFTSKSLPFISQKLACFVENVASQLGKSFVFFEIVEYGFTILRSVMHANGFVEYGDTNQSLSILCGVCKKTRKEHEATESLPFTHYFHPATFAIITGSQQFSTHDMNEIISVANDRRNDNGELLSVLIVSDALSVAYSFYNFLNVHILTPRDTESEHKQTVARVIRKKSHVIADSSVHVFNYVSMFGNEIPVGSMTAVEYLEKADMTMDLKKYVYADLKNSETGKLLRFLQSIGNLFSYPARHQYILFLNKIERIKSVMRQECDRWIAENPRDRQTVYIPVIPMDTLLKQMMDLDVSTEDLDRILSLGVVQTYQRIGICRITSDVNDSVVTLSPIEFFRFDPTILSLPLRSTGEQKSADGRPIADICLFWNGTRNSGTLRIGSKPGINIESLTKEELLKLIHTLDPSIRIENSNKNNIIKRVIEVLKSKDSSKLAYFVKV